jgi:hypothetical protein
MSAGPGFTDVKVQATRPPQSENRHDNIASPLAPPISKQSPRSDAARHGAVLKMSMFAEIA